MNTALRNRMNNLSVRLADRVDLAIEFATLGGYGLEPIEPAEAGCGQRECRDAAPTWEVSTPARRGSCAHPRRPQKLIDAYAGAFCTGR